MAPFGFEYFSQDAPSDKFAQSLLNQSRLYGITDESDAKHFGYLFQNNTPARPKEAPNSGTDAYQLVLVGLRPGEHPALAGRAVSPGKVGGLTVPPAGCLGAARKQLTGNETGQPTGESLASDLAHAAYNYAWDDPRSAVAKSDWSACMAKAGYVEKDPLTALGEINRDLSSKAPAAEIAEAVTDVKCKKSTDFVARVNKVNVEYSTAAVEKNQLALTSEKEFWASAVNKANVLISAG